MTTTTPNGNINHNDRVKVNHPGLPEATGTAIAPVWGSTTITVRLDGTDARVEIPEAWLQRTKRGNR